MHINIYARNILDTDALLARCQRLGVNHVVPNVTTMPGYDETGVPNQQFLGEFVQRLVDGGVQVPVAITWFGNDPNLVLDPAGHRKQIDAKRQTLEELAKAGIHTTLHYIDLAQSQDPNDDARYWEGFLTVFREIVDQAEATDVRIANHAIWRCIPDPLRQEALQQGVTMADYRQYHPTGWRGPYLLTDHTHIQRLLEAIPSSHNGVCFCTGMHIMGGDVPSLVDRFKGRIYYSQMRDVSGRWPAAEEVFLGSGDLDFDQILRRLHEAGYDGLIGPEHLGQPRRSGEDLEAEAVTFLQDKLAKLNITGTPT